MHFDEGRAPKCCKRHPAGHLPEVPPRGASPGSSPEGGGDAWAGAGGVGDAGGLNQRGARRPGGSLTRQRDCSFHGPSCGRMSHGGERSRCLLGGCLQRIISARKVALFWRSATRRTFLKGWQINLSAEHQRCWCHCQGQRHPVL